MSRHSTTTDLPPSGAHGPRAPSGSAPDPNAVLRALPLSTSDWKRVLAALVRLHNHLHSTKTKGVSFKTMADRQRFLFRFFDELRHETGFRDADPRGLSHRHVEAMVARWLGRGLATASLHNYLSFLRTFATWIDKPGMVREPAHYLGGDSPQARRTQVATSDKSWTAHGVDLQAKIAEVSAHDPWVGLQLELCAAFGMRPKEARHFRPHAAVLPRELADPRDAAAFPEYETFVRIRHGTKGGRTRDVPVVNEAQRELLARVAEAVAPGAYVGRPGRTPEQNAWRFYNVVRKFGITRAALGIVPHGLRHQHANDAYAADTGADSPVRGGDAKPAQDLVARERIARQLGHNRLRVASCYLGSSRAPAAAQPQPEPDGDLQAPA